MYDSILGTKQMWYHNGLHAGYIQDRYLVLNNNNEWETVFHLERNSVSQEEIDNGFIPYYYIVIDDYSVNVSEQIWNEITDPFFEMTTNAIPSKSLEEVFGDLIL